jgi:hypothetical protein
MLSPATIAPRIQAGDTVALSGDFISRHGMNKESMTQARGKVTAVHCMTDGTGFFVDLAWDRPGLSKRLNAKSLVIVTR